MKITLRTLAECDVSNSKFECWMIQYVCISIFYKTRAVTHNECRHSGWLAACINLKWKRSTDFGFRKWENADCVATFPRDISLNLIVIHLSHTIGYCKYSMNVNGNLIDSKRETFLERILLCLQTRIHGKVPLIEKFFRIAHTTCKTVQSFNCSQRWQFRICLSFKYI